MTKLSVPNPALDLLLTRASCDSLVEPAPKGEQLEAILAAAMRAPDHGKLRPWRYAIIKGKHREAFVDLVVRGMMTRDPDVPEKKLEKRRRRFGETPMTIALGMHVRPDNKIPVWEQEAAVSAAAMNVLNALHFSGFGGVWVSGDVAKDPAVAAALGFERPHKLLGFLFVGTPEKPASGKRGDITDYTGIWRGEPLQFGVDR